MNNIVQDFVKCPACGKGIQIELSIEMANHDQQIVDGHIDARINVTGARVQHDCISQNKRNVPNTIFNAENCHEAAAQR